MTLSLLFCKFTSYVASVGFKMASGMPVPHSLGKKTLNIMKYRRGETVYRSGDFQNSVSYVKMQEKMTKQGKSIVRLQHYLIK